MLTQKTTGSETEASKQLTRGRFGGFRTTGGRMALGLVRTYPVSFRLTSLANYLGVMRPAGALLEG